MGDGIYVVWLFTAVLAAHVGVVCVARAIAVFHPSKSCNRQRLATDPHSMDDRTMDSCVPSSSVPVPKLKHR
jgi:hypothetical protein